MPPLFSFFSSLTFVRLSLAWKWIQDLLKLTGAELQMKNLRTIINSSGNGIAMIGSRVSVARLGVKASLTELAFLPYLLCLHNLTFCLSGNEM